ncbi:Co-chaperone [Coemansia thaxteri]|uniref:Co-chaperone n=1 Tax=Coemansia thaxteri TaxID=2663907 RepID=A0A9W8BGY5_9FUNG|nr:Co-chaperone [Coemansia thaxteri]KAJ2009404.1 Co-chaperone [Coemansia thaxteri]KAJ2473926.1 Co-chaperone [Coemansia sp. RSA 2322]KAJ2480498.1 Co-chaperone [Coemansia sp. RSA 2320]
MADWRNIGNWHWKEKNCFEWAKQHLDKELVGTAVSADGFSAEVSSVDSVTGDVELNIRKGRLIAIYDVEVKLSWKAARGEEDTLTGRITIPEVAHDTDAYVYDISASNQERAKLPLKDFVRQKLTPEITKKLGGFTEELKRANGSAMYIPDNGSGASTPSASAASASDVKEERADDREEDTGAKSSSGAEVAKAAPAGFSTVAINTSAEFVCSASDLYAALTDPQRVSAWTRAEAVIQATQGSAFKLFKGHIEGKFTKLVPGKSIEQTWRVATWPAGHYSTVKMELEQLSSSTRLALKQTGVPLSEESATKANWDRYYWNSIKGTFG